MSDNAWGVIEPSDPCQSVSSRQARGVIAPTEGGHYANVNERPSMTLVTHWSFLKSIESEEGGGAGSPWVVAHPGFPQIRTCALERIRLVRAWVHYQW